MVELPELTEDQRIFLLTIFEHFHREGKWPTYLRVENTIRDMYPERYRKINMVEVSKGLPEGVASAFGLHRDYDQEATFLAPALYYFDEAKEEMADFIRVVQFCVEKINTSDEKIPQITSDDLSSQPLHMQPLAIRKMRLLLQWENDISFGGGANGEWWYIGLQRGIGGVRRFEGVETFEQYLEKRTALAPAQTARNYTGQTVLQLAKNRPTNVMPVMGATQIVQGDQYNISGNSGDVKIKSPTTEVAATMNERRNPWISGSFYLIVFVVVVVALSVAGHVLSTLALPIVVIGGLLALSIIGALQVRQDERLSEENFLKLMALSFKYLPWLRRQNAKLDKDSK
jgi:hypothetical protein